MSTVTTIPVVLAFTALLLLYLNQRKHMALLNTLAPTLQALQAKVNQISLNVQLLKDQVANGSQLPAEADALLANLNATVDALAANAAPAPGPLP